MSSKEEATVEQARRLLLLMRAREMQMGLALVRDWWVFTGGQVEVLAHLPGFVFYRHRLDVLLGTKHKHQSGGGHNRRSSPCPLVHADRVSPW